uniref:O-methyltransferase C-terminal domain-containing protein n=1 Tax=Vitis vinifera TaxID=29760 RepID=F6H5G1_VITVI
MVSDSRLIANMIVRQYEEVFEGLTSLVDVGDGTGTMAKAIAKAFPQLKYIVFDQPHVANLEVGENLEIVGGNIFEAIPPADAILLKKCKGAIPNKGGKVIIIDMVVESNKGDNKEVETQLFMDMLMMVVVAGKERNEKEWEKLFLAAGFTHYKITPALGLRSLIEVYP